MHEDKKQDVGKRLISALHALGLDSKNKIKAATGLTDHAIWRYGDGNRTPSLSQLQRLALAVPGLDLYWIITGRKAPQQLKGFDMPTLRHNGEYVTDPDWGESWLEERKLDVGHLAGWVMEENSWIPMLLPGDHIIFDRTAIDLNQAGPYILSMNGATPIMRKVEPAGKGKYFLSSGTPNTIKVCAEEIKPLGRVVAVLHQKP